ncbi:putative disease resistance RPP13-like protein 1 isoform X1 [Phaseolus vulgaris]|uniref:Disease resistance N-terminal domain-containing protein n=1 Tax=Phaseolus vulgaris TaxID=3885 RepID=V7C4G6_PHAVU|nr:hypothetical protein PHAVU_004G076100g [Phaseolus vulgaris]ESW23796.1 hypothetical protein PHAVU_004G076100g [Phaseolus vulgaris]
MHLIHFKSHTSIHSISTPTMAAELVLGALLSAFLQVAFDRIASPQFLDFFRGRKLDEKLLANLNIMLGSINALADDAELRQFTDPHVKAWLLAVKEAVFDAEDLLAEIDYELNRCQFEAQSQPQTFTYKVSLCSLCFIYVLLVRSVILSEWCSKEISFILMGRIKVHD